MSNIQVIFNKNKFKLKIPYKIIKLNSSIYRILFFYKVV